MKPGESGSKLIDFFHERFPFVSKEEWIRRIDNKWIHQDGVPLKADQIIETNQLIHHYSPRVVEPAVAGDVKVVQETEDWIVVDKPAPLPMHQGGRYYKNTLIYILKEMGYEDIKMVHRLDSVTSGLVLLAKNKATAITFRKMFEEGKVEKWYYAVIEGELKSEVTVDVPIRRKRGFVFECGEQLEGSKPAKTILFPEEYCDGKTIVKCIPVTGRTHQIRLHLQYIGYPIVDDPIYGPGGDQSGKQLQNSAISLRSSGMVIEEMDFRVIL